MTSMMANTTASTINCANALLAVIVGNEGVFRGKMRDTDFRERLEQLIKIWIVC